MLENEYTLYEACKKVDNEIISDFGGGSTVSKTFLMSYLASDQKLKTFVEIGVYRGKSLFSTAYSVHLNGGTSYGVDPYDLSCAKEYDMEETFKNQVNAFLDATDFESLYTDVLRYREVCGYGESIQFVRKTSEEAISFFKQKRIHPDLLHIDGNHDTKFVKKDFELYYEIMDEGSFIVFDDINWESVRPVYDVAKEKCHCIFEDKYFGVLLKADNSISTKIRVEKLQKKCSAIFERAIQQEETDSKPVIAVGMLTYNHEDYIEEAIMSVLEQQGDFNLHLIICDDKSTDSTADIIESVIAKIPQREGVTISFSRPDKNVGIIANLNKMINMIKETNCDYFSFCEGDDYYLSSDRLAKHVDFLKANPHFSMAYNKILLYWQNQSRFEIYDSGHNETVLHAEELVENNFIGNFSAAFYHGSVLNEINDSLFEEMFTVDWMFNIFCAQYGDIGFINKPYTVYRKHDFGVWSGQDDLKQCTQLIGEIDKYDKYLNFSYFASFQKAKERLYQYYISAGSSYSTNTSVMIIDDVFPHPLSGFRYQEFTSILEEIPDSKVVATTESIHVLGDLKADELFIQYKRNHPEISSQIIKYHTAYNLKAKLLYCTFIQNAYYTITNIAETFQIPFVFTLYPGGGFAIGTEEGDAKLRRVFNSPWFYKVIVTQDITYNYLIDNGFCTEDQIERIFGVVIPLDKLQIQIANKKHYGIDKDTLDICFVAHKYTKYGEDKGYDIFIKAAKELSKMYDHIRFHVVGPWDEEVISTKGIKHITFYGSHDQEWFDTFYADKDIILSPNIQGKIFKGSFDGFPTGCVTDAALRDVAMFLTDPLEMNQGHFVDGEEIVIVKHSVEDVVNRISYYLDRPAELKELIKRGHQKVVELYSYEAQIAPRIKLLTEALEAEFVPHFPETAGAEIVQTSVVPAILTPEVLPLWKRLYRKLIPKPVKYLWRIFKYLLKEIYREFIPNIIKRIYRKIKSTVKNLIIKLKEVTHA